MSHGRATATSPREVVVQSAADRCASVAGLRLLLFGLLIAGLVGMHQLSGADECCAGPASAATATGHVLDQGGAHPPSVPGSAPSLTAVASPILGEGAAGHGPLGDLLGMCLALVATAGSLLALALLRRRLTGSVAHVLAAAGRRAAAPPRGPPLTRRLAQLQVLRL